MHGFRYLRVAITAGSTAPDAPAQAATDVDAGPLRSALDTAAEMGQQAADTTRTTMQTAQWFGARHLGLVSGAALIFHGALDLGLGARNLARGDVGEGVLALASGGLSVSGAAVALAASGPAAPVVVLALSGSAVAIKLAVVGNDTARLLTGQSVADLLREASLGARRGVTACGGDGAGLAGDVAAGATVALAAPVVGVAAVGLGLGRIGYEVASRGERFGEEHLRGLNSSSVVRAGATAGARVARGLGGQEAGLGEHVGTGVGATLALAPAVVVGALASTAGLAEDLGRTAGRAGRRAGRAIARAAADDTPLPGFPSLQELNEWGMLP